MRSKWALPIFAEDIWLFLPGWFCLPQPIWAPGIRLDQKERRDFYSKDLPKSHPSFCQLCLATITRPRKKEWHRTLSQNWDSTPTFVSPSPLPNFQVVSPNIHCHLSCSVVQLLSRVQLCDPLDCSTPAFPVLNYLLEFVQAHVHWFGDVIKPSHPLLPPSPPALNLSWHQVCHILTEHTQTSRGKQTKHYTFSSVTRWMQNKVILLSALQRNSPCNQWKN